MQKPLPNPIVAAAAAVQLAFLRRRDLNFGEKAAALALWSYAGGRRGTVAIDAAELATLVGGSVRSAQEWLPRLAQCGILEVVERSSAVWTVSVDLSVGTPALSYVDDAQRVLFDPFANEGDEAGAEESSAPVIAFGQGRAETAAKSAADSAAKIAGTAVALRSPLNTSLKGISSLRSQSALTSELRSSAKTAAETARANGEPTKVAAALPDLTIAGPSADRWLGDVEAATDRIRQQVPWPLYAGVAERIAQGLCEGQLQPADVARAVAATERKIAAGALTCPPGAFFTRCMQRRIFDRGARWRLAR